MMELSRSEKIAKDLGIKVRNKWVNIEALAPLLERMKEVRDDKTRGYYIEIGPVDADKELKAAKELVGELLSIGSHASRHKLDKVFDKLYCWQNQTEDADSPQKLLAEYVRCKGHWEGRYPNWWARVNRWYNAGRE